MAQSAWIHDISGDNFKPIVIDGSSIQPVLVDFWAPWCAPCRTLGPILDSLIGQYAGRIHLAKVNTDEHPTLAQTYGIQGIPAVKLFHEGRIVEAFVGVQSERFIRNLIDKHLPKPESETVDLALAAAWRGDIREARDTLAPMREQHPDHVHTVLASCLVDILHGESAGARQTFDQLPATALADPLYERRYAPCSTSSPCWSRDSASCRPHWPPGSARVRGRSWRGGERQRSKTGSRHFRKPDPMSGHLSRKPFGRRSRWSETKPAP
ncbi:thioredoxin domain-containing protein, partial [mine drainage metagenome]